MILHRDSRFFGYAIRAASDYLKISEEFIEKDYWITFILHRLSQSRYADKAVFKGGTSLSKAYGLINRFSEDVDIAVIAEFGESGNEIKNIIRKVEKEISKEFQELQMEGVTSKGSRYRKTVFEYISTNAKNMNNKLILEINSFDNPFPYQSLSIKTLIFDFLIRSKNEPYIAQYGLQPFQVNVLRKEQTLLEKLVSLIRFSFDHNAVDSISKKVRHFYDLYFLMNDEDCFSYVGNKEFKEKFDKIFSHDKEIFNEPTDWQQKSVLESPLINNFENVWDQLKITYKKELTSLAFGEIPDETKVKKRFEDLIRCIM